MIYKRSVAASFLFLALYASIGFGAYVTSGRSFERAYPFFSWFLYVSVPQHIQGGYDIVVTAENGKTLPQPLPLTDANARFLDMHIAEQDVVNAAREFGRALEANRPADAADVRNMLEAHMITSLTYEVRKIQFDSLDYFKHGTIIRNKVLGTFTHQAI